MKTTLQSFVAIIVLLIFHIGCGQPGHKKEQKKIEQKRAQEERATADLNAAVAATDEIAWDTARAYKLFSDTINLHLAKNQQALADFRRKVSPGHKAVPLRYRRRIRRLEQRNDELIQRLDHYHINDKAGWEDFTTLYQYDLQKLETDILKLATRR